MSDLQPKCFDKC